jgi:orotidine-5'-phosphate decarboxylase
MNAESLIASIQRKRSCLCVGLDTDLSLIPAHLLTHEDPVFEFNKFIIEATADFTVAYKPNLAFYEAMGAKGWESLRKTLDVIPKDILTIADAKRGDIGNTATRYAEAFFNEYGFDAITVAPYMGSDSVIPFLNYPGKMVFLLALTSNPGAADFQLRDSDGEPLYRRVVNTALKWAEGQPGQLGFVVGATRPEYLAEIRQLAPASFFLVPGVGAQGGSLSEVMRQGMNDSGGLLINASRSILYASKGEDFALKAREEAKRMANEMDILLQAKGI